jgi:hypothetical protein
MCFDGGGGGPVNKTWTKIIKPRLSSMYRGETYLLVPHCSQFDNMGTPQALREFSFFMGVGLRAEERGQAIDECI